MKAKLTIDSVEVVKGVIYDDWMVRYSASGATKSADPKALKIYGRVEGIGEVVFFTPTVVLVKSFGAHTEFHNVYQENNWFSFNETVRESNSTDTLPAYVQFRKELRPTVKNGDEVTISFSVKGRFGNRTGLNRVKLIGPTAVINADGKKSEVDQCNREVVLS